MAAELIPKAVLRPGTLLDQDHADRFSAHLLSVKEPQLVSHFKNQKLDEVFRVSYFPAFTQVVSFRMQRRGQVRAIILKTGRGLGGYEPKGLEAEAKYRLPPRLWWEVTAWRDTKAIWVPGTFVKIAADGTEFATADGVNWLIEYVNQDGYRASVEHSPIQPDWRRFEAWARATFSFFGVDAS